MNALRLGLIGVFAVIPSLLACSEGVSTLHATDATEQDSHRQDIADSGAEDTSALDADDAAVLDSHSQDTKDSATDAAGQGDDAGDESSSDSDPDATPFPCTPLTVEDFAVCSLDPDSCLDHQSAHCDDANACTVDVCAPELGCWYFSRTCEAIQSDLCELASCDPELGCVSTQVDCDDGIACTEDICIGDVGCVAIPEAERCGRAEACTELVCDWLADCTPVLTEGPCNDDDPCTQLDRCTPGGCVGVPTLCDDGDACTEDSCSVDDGCLFAPKACADTDPCTVDQCGLDGQCQHVADACDDGDACTVDSCEAEVGCVHDAVSCKDSDVCTAEFCYPSSGCVYSVSTCDDLDACTIDICAEDGSCSYEVVDCADGSVCTSDECDPAVGCLFAPVFASCEANPNSFCHPILGCENLVPPCPDSEDPCIIWVRSGGHCVQTLTPCDDGVFCSLDFCVPGEGCKALPKDEPCNDGDPTTKDWCEPKLGCLSEPWGPVWCELSGEEGEDVFCNFDIVRTDPGAFAWAATFEVKIHWRHDQVEFWGFADWLEFPGVPPFLVDVPPTTLYPSGHEIIADVPVEEADAVGGTHILVINLQQPESLLTNAKLLGGETIGNPTFMMARFRLLEAIDAEAPSPVRAHDWYAGSPDVLNLSIEFDEEEGYFVIPPVCETNAECDDANVCTHDWCNNGNCLHDVDDDVVDDYDLCTVDTCAAETGPVHTPMVCKDGNPCTEGQCNSGYCNFFPIDPEDGDACTADFCSPEVGVFHLWATCFDGTLCTQDYCQPGLGCVNKPICGDDFACTLDYCAGSKCAYDPDHAYCDDDDALTDDYCAPELPESDAEGCIHTVP